MRRPISLSLVVTNTVLLPCVVGNPILYCKTFFNSSYNIFTAEGYRHAARRSIRVSVRPFITFVPLVDIPSDLRLRSIYVIKLDDIDTAPFHSHRKVIS
jgi:hypothetical protein